VNVGVSTTYTATVTPPSTRPGPVEPSGSVEFLDGGQPIGSCLSQPLTNGGATCTVTYMAVGRHSISARYLGDGNFTGSSSAVQAVSAVPVPPHVLGTITSTMQWTFFYTPFYTEVRALVLNGAPAGSTVRVKCHGRGCPFAAHATIVTKSRRCAAKSRRGCSVRSVNLASAFAHRQLRVGAQVAVVIVRRGWIGKYYGFTIQAGRGPRVYIGCLPPGATRPRAHC
jgi:hypothetical protein